ncbi:MAG: hypothetical protein WC595_06935 [Candidatus Nanoarchaeia archaeon]
MMKLLSKYKKEWMIIVLLPVLILFLDQIGGRAGLYQTIVRFDEFMHFGGGITIAVSYFLLIKIAQKEKLIGEMNMWIYFAFVISLVALTAVTWEFYEYILDVVLPSHVRQPSIKDTMGDLLMGLLGGSLGFLIGKSKWLKK